MTSSARGVAVVTGAGSELGIGREICRRLASEGHAIALCDRAGAGLAAAAAELERDFGVRALARVVDVTDEGSVERFRDEVQSELGGVRVLVNNAGINRSAAFEQITLADWDEVFRVNVTGAFLVTRAFLPTMRELDWSRVIFISSLAAIRGGGFFSGSAHYSASKAALIGLTRALAREAGADGVTVNAIAPGFVGTEMTGDDAAQLAAMVSLTPVGRVGRPADVASLVGYLASEGSGYVTGATIDVNGGSHIR